jgi:hypothetical protein
MVLRQQEEVREDWRWAPRVSVFVVEDEEIGRLVGKCCILFLSLCLAGVPGPKLVELIVLSGPEFESRGEVVGSLNRPFVDAFLRSNSAISLNDCVIYIVECL